MCGITAYLGQRQALDLLVAGLKRLEYRGYDSAGLCCLTAEGEASVVRRPGKVANLEKAAKDLRVEGTTGISHTRWATHGSPSEANAHPHTSEHIHLVHNGIIENYAALKTNLIQHGYEFKSETDTEVLCHLIHKVEKTVSAEGHGLAEAVRQALVLVTGTFGLVVCSEKNPNMLVAARCGSPVIIGVGEGEFFIASDASAMVEHTKRVIFLDDKEVVECRLDNGVAKFDISSLIKGMEGAAATPGLVGRGVSPYEQARARSAFDQQSTAARASISKDVEVIDLKLEEIEKGGYEHFMLKEIMDQPNCLRNCMRGRVRTTEEQIVLLGLKSHWKQILAAKRFIICACGTSWHAGLVGEYLIEKFSRTPVEVEYASEFRYRDPILRGGEDVLIVISQSGETADTLEAVMEAKKQGCLTLGVVNAVGSTIARETDCGVYLHAGPEIGVASTKAFTAQVAVLTMISLLLGGPEGHNVLSQEDYKNALTQMAALPDQIAEITKQNDLIREMSKQFRYAQNFLYLARGFNFPVALEGALKLKEISYIHAEGYPAAEMKHGPIALIDPFMPVVFIALRNDPIYDKIRGNIHEVQCRQGVVIIITDEDNHDFDESCEHIIRIPLTSNFLTPLLTVIPLQILSYHIAKFRSCAIDQPRNLAKSVTV